MREECCPSQLLPSQRIKGMAAIVAGSPCPATALGQLRHGFSHAIDADGIFLVSAMRASPGEEVVRDMVSTNDNHPLMLKVTPSRTADWYEAWPGAGRDKAPFAGGRQEARSARKGRPREFKLAVSEHPA